MNDLELAYSTIADKRARYEILYQYEENRQPVRYVTERMAEVFGTSVARFAQNWCKVVVQSALDRLVLLGWNAKAAKVNQAIDAIFDAYGVGVDAEDIHRDALITGEGYMMIWPAENGLDIYRNDPRMIHLFYQPDRPKVKRFAAKIYTGADDHQVMKLYYPDRIETYRAANAGLVSSAGAFVKNAEDDANPTGVIPVFRFSAAASQLQDALPLQDAINKLFTDLMVVSEFGAFKQRYIITNADVAVLKNSPNIIWSIPAGDGTGQGTQVGEFAETPSSGFLQAMNELASALAVITSTPKHYIGPVGAGISGDALIAMEAPLIKKVAALQKRFSSTWREVAVFLLSLSGVGVKMDDLSVLWGAVETLQPAARAHVILTETQAGIPLLNSAGRNGFDPGEVEKLEADLAEAEKRKAAEAQLLLERIRAEAATQNMAGNYDVAE